MLERLVGRTHQVCTGVALRRFSPHLDHTFHVITDVTFHPLSTEQIHAYLAKINPLDKAGGYAAQDHGSDIIAETDVSWTNVVGLPMESLAAQFEAIGFSSQPRS